MLRNDGTIYDLESKINPYSGEHDCFNFHLQKIGDDLFQFHDICFGQFGFEVFHALPGILDGAFPQMTVNSFH